MINVLLIGKMNGLTKDINNYLSENDKLRVQVCTENAETVKEMMIITEPQIVVICLYGMDKTQEGIFRTLMVSYPEIPVITIGTIVEYGRFILFYDSDQFENLLRPTDNATVIEAVFRRAGYSSPLRKKVLVVDDNGTTLRSIKMMLEDIYDVIPVNSGMSAMKAIGKCRPDLILLDYEMPICDGRQTLEMIRADEEIANIPVVFLTAIHDKEHVAPIMKLHPAGYILKPPVMEEIRDCIARVLWKNRPKDFE